MLKTSVLLNRDWIIAYTQKLCNEKLSTIHLKYRAQFAVSNVQVSRNFIERKFERFEKLRKHIWKVFRIEMKSKFCFFVSSFLFLASFRICKQLFQFEFDVEINRDAIRVRKKSMLGEEKLMSVKTETLVPLRKIN